MNWSRLRHAYGSAKDTPGHLTALYGDDQAAMDAAIDHLEVAVLHQGFPYSATAPAARVVASLLDQWAVDPRLHAALLRHLGWVAEATVHAEHDTYFSEYLPALHEAIVETYRTVWAFIDLEDPNLRMVVIAAAVKHVGSAVLADRRPEVVSVLRERVDSGEHRVWHLRHLVDLGEDVSGYLTDADADVRTIAALAPMMAGRDDANAILVDALTQATAVLADLGNHPDPLREYADSLLDSGGLRGYSLPDLVRAVVDRGVEFDSIAVPAAHIVRTASWTGFDRTWGPLVLKAFRTRYQETSPLSDVQRRILGALIDNPQLWDVSNGSVALVFKTAGLPHDRQACRRILR